MVSSRSDLLVAVFLPQEWETYARRPHWSAIAELVNLLAIEPPMGILTVWLHPERLIRYFRREKRVRQGEAGIFFYRPISLASYGVAYRFPWLARIDRFLLSAQLKRVIRSFRSQHSYLISFVVKVQQYYVTDILPAALKCYEVTDEPLAAPGEEGLGNKNIFIRRIRQAESRILSQADLIFASSQALCATRSKHNPNTYYIPNCADYNHFSKAINVDLEIPPDLREIPSPRIGYIGSINELIDMDLLNMLAQTRPDWSIVLIGKEYYSKVLMQSAEYKESKSRLNIHYLGFKEYDLLPAYIRGFDVCLLPFCSCEWMKNSFPNKIHQYLSAGKPVVSTDFPAVWYVQDAVYIARDRRDFLQLVERALMEDNQRLREVRMTVARENSTEVQAQKKLDILNRVFAQKIKIL